MGLRQKITNIKSRPVDFGVSGINGSGQEIRSEEVLLPLFNPENKRFDVEAVVIERVNENITLPDIDYLKTRFPELKSIEFPILPEKPVQILIGQNAPAILSAIQADLYKGNGHPNVRFTSFGPALGFVESSRSVSMNHFEIIPTMVSSEKNVDKINQESTSHSPETNTINKSILEIPVLKTQSSAEDQEMKDLIQKLINDDDSNLTRPEKRLQSPVNEELENKIRKSFRRTEEGHMEVPIFWKNKGFSLKCNFVECQNFDKAQKRKIVQQNPAYWEYCIGELQKQVDYGAARILDVSEDKNEGFYHPLVVIVKPEKKSTPIRICLDASRKFKQLDGKKKCFNDQMPTGTNLLNDLSKVLINFRTSNVTLFCDLTKMFLNVRVPEHQRRFLRFVFNEIVYESAGFPFGLRYSPYVTSLCLKLCAEQALKMGEITQETFNRVDKFIYMDDGLFAAESDLAAIDLAHQLMKVFDSVQMRFTKFGSNSKQVLQSIPEERRLSEINFSDPTPEAGTLGIKYDADKDEFSLSPLTELASTITKAEIMRIAAKVYDPANFLAVITIRARKLTQLIFQIPKPEGKEIPWKQDLEDFRSTCPDLIEQIVKGYYEIGEEFKTIDDIKIPRPLSLNKPIKEKHLVIFGDGSGIAYGACAYLRTSYKDGSVTVRLVRAAKKCTPVRSQTIPRIELMASLEAAKLSSNLQKILNPDHITLFTDALVVLFWIKKSDIHRFDDWTQVRLTKIHELTKNAKWRHVESQLNPSDLLSRGVRKKDIYHEGKFTEKGLFWMEGPAFLKEDFAKWPIHERELLQIMSSEEKEIIQNSYKTFKSLITTENQSAKTLHTMTQTTNILPKCLDQDECSSFPKSCLNIFRQGEDILGQLKTEQVVWAPDQLKTLQIALSTYPLTNYDRYGSIHKAARITRIVKEACQKWISKIRRSTRSSISLSDVDIKNCYIDVVKRIQAEGFRKEFQLARKQKMWPVNSQMNLVNALFDAEGLLRANARLSSCPGLRECERKPLLFPLQHPMLQVLIQTYHLNIGHGGSVSELMAGLRIIWYFPRMRQTVKKYLNKCVPCQKKYGKPFQPHMGNLPVNFQSMQIFESVSIDFFGPIKVYRGRETRGRTATENFYILVIACMQIHAINLEMCEGMDTGQVLSALQRFVCRKRMPRKIRSDNFKSFESSKNAIATKAETIDVKHIQDVLKFPVWENSPPAAPDQNLAETFVRLVKKRLDLDLKNRTFHRDELSTLLMMAEDSVNSRPLTFLSDDINDPIPITANRLLKPAFYSSEGINIKEGTPKKYRQYYENLTEFANQLFQRWRDEFKIVYQKYPKWKAWRQNAKEGDLVLVTENNPLTPKDWSLGIIVKTYPDKADGIVRKCLVRYKIEGSKILGTHLRHTRNMIPLNLWHNFNENL